jgi:FtsZ-interacting cell division protein YlmF/DNA-binding XRE family transcriptional regulator
MAEAESTDVPEFMRWAEEHGAGFMSTDERFARNLRDARERHGLSQADVASEMTKAGFSFHQQTVAKIESGSRTVRLSEAEKLASVLGTSVGVLTLPPHDVQKVRRLNKVTFDLRRAISVVVAAYKEMWKAELALERELGGLRRRDGTDFYPDSEPVKKAANWARHAEREAHPYRVVDRAREEFASKYNHVGNSPNSVVAERLRDLDESLNAERRREREPINDLPPIERIQPKDYEVLRRVADHVQDGGVVILDLQHMSTRDQLRAVDFSAGVVAGLGGVIHRAAKASFVIFPPEAPIDDVLAHLGLDEAEA